MSNSGVGLSRKLPTVGENAAGEGEYAWRSPSNADEATNQGVTPLHTDEVVSMSPTLQPSPQTPSAPNSSMEFEPGRRSSLEKLPLISGNGVAENLASDASRAAPNIVLTVDSTSGENLLSTTTTTTRLSSTGGSNNINISITNVNRYGANSFLATTAADAKTAPQLSPVPSTPASPLSATTGTDPVLASLLSSTHGPKVILLMQIAVLLHAASVNDTQQIRDLLAAGIPATLADYDRRTALHLACAEGALEVAELLVKAGANINARDRFGYAPLDDAIRHGHVSTAAFMERLGAMNAFAASESSTDDARSHKKKAHSGEKALHAAQSKSPRATSLQHHGKHSAQTVAAETTGNTAAPGELIAAPARAHAADSAQVAPLSPSVPADVDAEHKIRIHDDASDKPGSGSSSAETVASPPTAATAAPKAETGAIRGGDTPPNSNKPAASTFAPGSGAESTQMPTQGAVVSSFIPVSSFNNDADLDDPAGSGDDDIGNIPGSLLGRVASRGGGAAANGGGGGVGGSNIGLAKHYGKMMSMLRVEIRQIDKDILSVFGKADHAAKQWAEQEEKLQTVRAFLVKQFKQHRTARQNAISGPSTAAGAAGPATEVSKTNGAAPSKRPAPEASLNDGTASRVDSSYDPTWDTEDASFLDPPRHKYFGTWRDGDSRSSEDTEMTRTGSTPVPAAPITADMETAQTAVEAIPEQHRDTADYQTKDESFFTKRELLSGQAEWYHIAAWAVGCILSAVYFSWNAGLIAGWGTFFVASCLTCLAYWLLTCCLSEMASALPFSGGSYGFARATMGKLPGMLVGLAESLEYILTTAVNMLILGQLCSSLFGTNVYLEVLWIAIAYVISVGLHIYGGRTYWNFTLVIVTIDVLIVVLFWVGTASFANFNENALVPDVKTGEEQGWFVGGFNNFMVVLPISIWWCTGIEAMPLACEETIESKKQVPKGMLWGMGIILALNFGTYLSVTSVPTDQTLRISGGLEQPTLFESLFVFKAGFQRMFGLADYNSPLLALILFPGIFASAFGFIFAYGRQMYAMSRSGLLPEFISLTCKYGTPHLSMITGSLLGFAVCIIGRVSFPEEHSFAGFQTFVYNCMLLVALVNYITQLCSFLILRTQFTMLTRGYTSPLGIPGAVVGILIFGWSFVALLGWGHNVWVAIVFVSVYMSLGLSYYYFKARKNLLLSPEEQVALFMVYSINFIRSKQDRVKNAKKYKLDKSMVQNMETQGKAKLKTRLLMEEKKKAVEQEKNSSKDQLLRPVPISPLRGAVGAAAADPHSSADGGGGTGDPATPGPNLLPSDVPAGAGLVRRPSATPGAAPRVFLPRRSSADADAQHHEGAAASNAPKATDRLATPAGRGAGGGAILKAGTAADPAGGHVRKLLTGKSSSNETLASQPGANASSVQLSSASPRAVRA
jgi:ethanolamine permease